MTTKAQILRTIREKCLDCSVYQPREVRLCPVHTCALHPYRFGVDPNPSSRRGFAKSPLVHGRKSAKGGELMVTKAKAPACVGAQSRSKTNPLKRLNLMEIGEMKVPHHPQHINQLPLWTAARVRDLKRANSASIKLSKQLGVSESVARVIADLSGLGSKEGC